MSSRLTELFEDESLVEKLKRRLPYLFQLAQLETSRGRQGAMEAGSLREKIITALLICKFGEENVDTDVPVTEPEVDAKLFGHPVSIKTITGKGFSGVKLSWTVDAQKAQEFKGTYYPSCEILFVQIVWGGEGGFYYIPVEIQRAVLKEIGREKYMKLPKPGTNPRGVEITKDALSRLVGDRGSKAIAISWQKTEVDYNPYKRWVDYWQE